MVLGNQAGFRNLTTQIQNLTSEVDSFRNETITKIEVSLKYIFDKYYYVIET